MAKRDKVPINNKILEWLIQDLNVDINTTAKKAGVKPQQIQDWVEKKDFPTYKQAEKLAYKVFKKPIAIFFMEEIPESLSIRKKFRSIPELIYESISYKTRIAVNNADYFRTVFYEVFKFNPSPNPIFRELKLKDISEPFKTAMKIREILGINYKIQSAFNDKYKAFNYYRGKLEEAGVFSFQLQLEGDRAFCILDNEFPLIIVNSSDSVYSKIFSLFHELTHILLETDDVFKEVEPDYYSNDPIEMFCNKVASEILVPTDEFIKMFSNFGINQIKAEIKEIASNYCVSNEVIFRKFLDMGKINNKEYMTLKTEWDNAFKQRKKSGGDFYRNKVSALGKGYIKKVIYEYDNGNINDIQVSEYLGIKYSQLSKIQTEVYSK